MPQDFKDPTDLELLRSYSAAEDESAFRQLVDRHFNFVFRVALQKSGQPEIAEEVLQDVFAILARKARRLESHPSIPAWLYRATSYQAAKNSRKEKNHRRKIQTAMTMREPSPTAEPEPLDDDSLNLALAKLSNRDREIILLTYYQGYSSDEVAAAVGQSAAAVRKRASRAITQLKKFMSARGLATSTAALTAALLAPVKNAPAGLSNSTATAALNTASSVTLPNLVLTTAATMSKVKLITITAVGALALIAIPIAHRHKQTDDPRSPIAQAATDTDKFGTRASLPERQDALTALNSKTDPSASPSSHEASLAKKLYQILQLDNQSLRAHAIQELIQGLDTEGFIEAVSGFEDAGYFLQKESEYDSEYAVFMSAWALLSPQRAMAHADKKNSDDARKAVLTQWTISDPEAALAWSERTLENGINRWIPTIVETLATDDVERAEKFAASLPLGSSERLDSFYLLSKTHSQDGLEASLEWAQKFEDSDSYDAAASALSSVFSNEAPERLVDLLETVENVAHKQRIAERVTNAFANADIEKAKEWTEGSDPELRDAAASGIIARLSQNPRAAAAWLSELKAKSPETNFSDTASDLTWQVINGAGRSSEDFQLVAPWIEELSDSIRERKAEFFAKGWSKHDPEAAAEWFSKRKNTPGTN